MIQFQIYNISNSIILYATQLLINCVAARSRSVSPALATIDEVYDYFWLCSNYSCITSYYSDITTDSLLIDTHALLHHYYLTVFITSHDSLLLLQQGF
jgi:hypothetical protein